tara:strand:- start:434 stop:595 length:162 start_codon:yes stop_codon:yes gene_type:complete
MDNFTLFICGLVVTLIAGMGVITSEVFLLGYKKFMENGRNKEEENNGTIKQVV